MSVSAATIKGYGPTSVAINVTTEEEGMLILMNARVLPIVMHVWERV